jgi:hypothetical protein
LNITYISYYILYISYYVLAILYYVLYISYYVLDEYSLVLVLNKILKKLKSVMKKLFGGKSMVGMTDTLFQSSSSAISRQAEILRHVDPTLVGWTYCFQIDDVILIFLYHFAIWIYWLFFISFCRTGRAWVGGGHGGCGAGRLRGCGVGGEIGWRIGRLQVRGGGCG